MRFLVSQQSRVLLVYNSARVNRYLAKPGTMFIQPILNHSTAEALVLYKPNGTDANSGADEFYVGNGSLTHGLGLGPDPTAAFPFNRLAVTGPIGTPSPYIYLYHQLNETAFGEEQWNRNTGVWTSSTISVDASS